MIESPALFSLNLCALIVILFSVHLLFLRAIERQAYLPLAMCLLSVGIVVCQPTLAGFAAPFRPYALIVSLPALLLIAPAFWLYVKGLTAPTPWKFEKSCLKHFVLAGGGLLLRWLR